MRKLITLLFITMVVPVLSAERLNVDPGRFPVTGLTSLELRRVITVASTNVADSVTISSVFVHKNSVSIGTVATRDDKTVASHSLVLKSDKRKWNLINKIEPENKSLTVGLLPEDLDSFVRSLPLGPKILSIVVDTKSKLTVQTGHVAGPLAGHGKYLIYEKQKGKWTKTKESMWIS